MADKPKRKSTRFRSDETASLNGSIPALVVSESYTGCGLLLRKDSAPREGDEVRVKVGQLAPLRGKVRWRRELDEDACKIGIEFLE